MGEFVFEFESDGDDEAILNEIIAVMQRLNAERRRVGGPGLEIVTIQIGSTAERGEHLPLLKRLVGLVTKTKKAWL